MEEKVYKIQHRADTAANWELENPVLLLGEYGHITDSAMKDYKIGDGKTHWNDLPKYTQWSGEGVPSLDGYLYMGVAMPELNPGTPKGKVFYLASKGGNYTNFGNVAVSDGTLTALTWDGKSWKAEALITAGTGGAVNLTQKISDAPGKEKEAPSAAAVHKKLVTLEPLDNLNSDFSISDENGYDIVQFKNGHIKTRYFDSSKITDKPDQDTEIKYLDGISFTARIPIFKKCNRYYTTYNFYANKIAGNKTIYLSANGSDSNDGLSPLHAKKTFESAISANPSTIILSEGIYNAGEAFASGFNIDIPLNIIACGEVTIDNKELLPLNIRNSAFIERIKFKGGKKGALSTYQDSLSKIVTCIDCEFNESIVDNPNIGQAQSLGGIRIQGGTVFLYRCKAFRNGHDGFNYHSAPDGNSANAPHIAEVECIGMENGLNDSFRSNNATTAHDGAKVVRLNCKLGMCFGGVLADIHLGTISHNFGCNTFSSLVADGTQYASNYFCSENAEMHLYGCTSDGSPYDIAAFSGGKVYTDNLFTKNYSAGGQIIKTK